MARYNEILVGRYNRFFQKLFQMKGGAPVPQLAGDIQASLPLFSGVENRYLEGWERFGTALDQPAVAANTAAIRLRNPLTSNCLVVFEKLLAMNRNAAADQPLIENGVTATDLGTVYNLASSRIDQRSRPNPTLIGSHQSLLAVPALTNTFMQISYAAAGFNWDFILDDAHQLVLLPGDALQYRASQVNTELTISVIWRERFLEESERT